MNATDTFLNHWTGHLGLRARAWRSGIRKHASKLPFIEPSVSVPLLEFLLAGVPPILARRKDADTVLLAEAYGWLCFALWQCESAFPVFPENYAAFLREALAANPVRRDPSALLLARMIVDLGAVDGKCGFNRLRLADPAAVRESETLMGQGRYEFYLKARAKYDEYAFYLDQSKEFRTEWSCIKRAFAKEIARRQVLRRSPVPERNWERGPGAVFRSREERLQAVFDFFCWKYFLWGMEGDRPLLLKTSVVFTPHGTQIFIPGYLSFDPKRDLDFTRVMRLHRARGIPRQGEGFSVSRTERAQLKQRARVADAEARKRSLRGEARHRYICQRIGFYDRDDYRRLRKLLQP